jgi:hypothetical protein
MLRNIVRILIAAAITALNFTYLYSQYPRVEGYKGIWFTLGQFTDYGDKYSGGLGTYTADHVPIAIYSPEARKTFFVYGGTTGADKRHLLDMVSYYDHVTGEVPKPVVVYDKEGVDDPHDNSAISIDNQGYIWVFVSGRMRLRPGYIFRSSKPYSIDNFEKIREAEMTYPQPWWVKGKGFFYLFTKYTNGRELYWSGSPDGKTWTPDQKLAGMGGHYQVTNMYKGKLVSVFNFHPGGNVDKRTNLYAVQTTDLGKTWTTIDGKPLQTPLTDTHCKALVYDYQAEHKLVYINDLNFDSKGNPVILAIISHDFRPGPAGNPREWMIIHWKGDKWEFNKVCESTHNYDMGSLYIEKDCWKIIGPTDAGPQFWGAGGEIAMWKSTDEGRSWKKTRTITQGSTRNNSYVRRPVNPNDEFYALWADGDADKLSESHLWFSDKEGKTVRELPYNMTENLAKPAVRPLISAVSSSSGSKREGAISYPETPLDSKSSLFSLSVNGKEIFTQEYKTFHYAQLTLPTAMAVTLTCSEKIESVSVSPEKFGITPKPIASKATFVLPKPGYYMVKVNQKHKLFIFAEAPVKEPSGYIINATDLGVATSGRTQTIAIQKAINSVSGTGKTLVFPAGIYISGSLSVPSNTSIFLSAGAVIRGSDDLAAFDFNDKVKPLSFIRISDAENVSITGRGIIDILLCENVEIRNVKMLNDIGLSNTDSFDPDASKNVLIENCFGYCSDDNVAIKTTGSSGYPGKLENLTAGGKKCNIISGCGITKNDFSDISFY